MYVQIMYNSPITSYPHLSSLTRRPTISYLGPANICSLQIRSNLSILERGTLTCTYSTHTLHHIYIPVPHITTSSSPPTSDPPHHMILPHAGNICINAPHLQPENHFLFSVSRTAHNHITSIHSNASLLLCDAVCCTPYKP